MGRRLHLLAGEDVHHGGRRAGYGSLEEGPSPSRRARRGVADRRPPAAARRRFRTSRAAGSRRRTARETDGRGLCEDEPELPHGQPDRDVDASLDRLPDALLEVSRFDDYCPNGLQVEGRAQIAKARHRGDAPRSRSRCGDRPRRRRGARAPRLVLEGRGGAVTGAQERGSPCCSRTTSTSSPTTCRSTRTRARQQRAARAPAGLSDRRLVRRAGHRRVARTGGAADAGRWPRASRSAWPARPADRRSAARAPPRLVHRRCAGPSEARALGVDVFFTGEIAERTSTSRGKSGVAFLAAGHHATERYGVQALGAPRRDVRHRARLRRRSRPGLRARRRASSPVGGPARCAAITGDAVLRLIKALIHRCFFPVSEIEEQKSLSGA